MEPHTQISSLYTWITTLFSNTRIIYLLRDPNHCAKKKKKKEKKEKKKKIKYTFNLHNFKSACDCTFFNALED